MDLHGVAILIIWFHGMAGGFFFGWFVARGYFLKRVQVVEK